jgi:hypothetical protein
MHDAPSNSPINDAPVRRPDDDRYGIDALAQALARALRSTPAPEGLTLGITGPWGSGKTSLISLLRYHLNSDGPNITVCDFSPWWFFGAEALTRGFFEVLGSALAQDGPSEGAQDARRVLGAIWRRVRSFGNTAAALGDTVAGLGAAAAGFPAVLPAGSFARDLLPDGTPPETGEESLSADFARLAGLLRMRERRILIVIDDLDRLDPDEALTVLRLIKSVGRLPNVIYLLAYDHAVLRDHLRRRFGERAGASIEKIVQLSYEVPAPTPHQMAGALWDDISRFFPAIANGPRAMEIMLHCVRPCLRQPRDVARLTNAIRVGWPGLESDANGPDFIAMEALKIAFPTVYGALRGNPEVVCGVIGIGQSADGDANRGQALEELLLGDVPMPDRAAVKDALGFIFPTLMEAWSPMGRTLGPRDQQKAQRRVCVRECFDAYFRLAPGPDVLSSGEATVLLSHIDDSAHVLSVFRDAIASQRRPDGQSRVPLLLEELAARVDAIPAQSRWQLLRCLGEIADEFDLPEDRQIGAWTPGNLALLERLLIRVFRDETDPVQRAALLESLVPTAALGWLIWLTYAVCAQHASLNVEGKRADVPLVSEPKAAELRAAALTAIRTRANGGRLDKLPLDKIHHALHAWANWAADDGLEARQWTDTVMNDRDGVILLCRAFLTQVRNTNMVTGVGTNVPTVDRKAVSRVCDFGRLLREAASLRESGALPDAERGIVDLFLSVAPSSQT